MHRHFVPAGTLEAARVALDHANSRHFLNVLRLGRGDEVELFDGQGATARYVIADAARGGVSLERRGEVVRHPRPACRLVLGACISKGKRMEWTIEKAVELGAAEIIPIASRFSVVRLDDEGGAEKRERWMRIAIDAARQCSAVHLPEITEPMPLDAALRRLAPAGSTENATALFAGALQPDAIPFRDALAALRASGRAIRSAAWLVGPEGDFSPDEYDALRAAGVAFVSLGDLVLRTETAAIYGLCVLGAEFLVHAPPAGVPLPGD